MGSRKCIACGVELSSKNWPDWAKNNAHYKCGDCLSLGGKKYYLEHKEAINIKCREWYLKNKDTRRQTKITSTDSDGKNITIKCQKRRYTNMCEICGRERKLVSYHHWIKETPEIGMWLCSSCHFVANILEKLPHFGDLYHNLKTKLELEYVR